MIEGIWGDPIVVSFVHNSSLIKIKVIREIRFSVSLKEISYYLLTGKKMSRVQDFYLASISHLVITYERVSNSFYYSYLELLQNTLI